MTIGAPVFYPASPIAIRDGTVARVATVPGLTEVFKARTMPGQDSQLPYAIVWNSGERTEPNGDDNTGAVSFVHTLTLVVDVMTRAADEKALDTEIVLLVETIRATLMTDPNWIMLFEGIRRCDTRYSYPKEASDIMVQAMIEFEVTFRSEWPPFLPNDLTAVTTTARPMSGPWTCRYCATSNRGSSPSCSVCRGPRPIAEPILSTIDLKG